MDTTTAYYLLSTVLLGTLTVLFARWLRGSTLNVADLNGPPPSSWLAGNLPSFVRAKNVGDADAMFVEKYGLAFRIKGLFNTDVIYLADPQGIQYVLNTCGYTFHRKGIAGLLRLITGPSLIALEGEEHARQRKIILPGLSQGILKELVPLFTHVAERVAGKWKETLQEEGHPSCVIDVYSWLSRLTLDAMGQGVFSYDFGSVHGTPSEFVELYRNLFVNMFHKPSDVELASRAILCYIPLWFFPVLRLLPVRGMKNLTNFQTVARKIALEIVQREQQALVSGLPQGKDILSSLVRANISEDVKSRMSDDEIQSQMLGLMLAGHDTTSATLVWVFFELSRHPEVQNKLREEISAARAAAEHGELGFADFESMAYTLAVIKETLRCYPIASHNSRTAGCDEVIPLSKPTKTVSGREISAVPVKKGQSVLISIWAYNRIKHIWGDDAELWNPERFLGDRLSRLPKTSLGVYANLATFSSGVHSCPGWHFAILEMQAVLITLIEQFALSPPPNNITILQASAPLLFPMVEGREDLGAYMPLTITPIN